MRVYVVEELTEVYDAPWRIPQFVTVSQSWIFQKKNSLLIRMRFNRLHFIEKTEKKAKLKTPRKKILFKIQFTNIEAQQFRCRLITNKWLQSYSSRKSWKKCHVEHLIKFLTRQTFFWFCLPRCHSFLRRSVTLKLCQSIESSIFNNNSTKKEEGKPNCRECQKLVHMSTKKSLPCQKLSQFSCDGRRRFATMGKGTFIELSCQSKRFFGKLGWWSCFLRIGSFLRTRCFWFHKVEENWRLR